MAHNYHGLKDSVKDEIARIDRPSTLKEMIVTSVRIDNRQYERQREKGRLPFEKEKDDHKHKHKHKHRQAKMHDKYEPKTMEIDVITEKKFQGDCYSCGKKGHLARDCRGPKKSGNQKDAKGKSKGKTPHESLSWVGCYDDDCATHRSDKDNAGWYPQATINLIDENSGDEGNYPTEEDFDEALRQYRTYETDSEEEREAERERYHEEFQEWEAEQAAENTRLAATVYQHVGQVLGQTILCHHEDHAETEEYMSSHWMTPTTP